MQKFHDNMICLERLENVRERERASLKPAKWFKLTSAHLLDYRKTNIFDLDRCGSK